MMTRQVEAVVACAIPDDFEVDCADRQTCWNALPARVKKYITQLRISLSQQATFSTQGKRTDGVPTEGFVLQERTRDLEAVADAAWSNRFKDAQSFKVAVLKQAHACKLRRLREAWDNSRFKTGAVANACSLHQLDSVLLENILGRLDRKSLVYPDLWEVEAAAVLRWQGDGGWHARRVVAQVCRLFDCALPSMPSLECLVLNRMAFAPDACENQSLSSVLSKCTSLRRFFAFDVQLPCSWQAITRLPLQVASLESWSQQGGSAAPGVRVNTALQNLSLIGVAISPDREQKLATALTAAASLQQLTLGLQNVTPGGHESLADALPRMKALRCLNLIDHLETHVFEKYAAALPRCRQLDTLALTYSIVHDNAAWSQMLATAASACPALRHVDLDHLRAPSDEPLRLGAFWQALPDIKCLESVSVSNTGLLSIDVCLLCTVLERCARLKALTFSNCGLEHDSIRILQWAVSKLETKLDVT